MSLKNGHLKPLTRIAVITNVQSSSLDKYGWVACAKILLVWSWSEAPQEHSCRKKTCDHSSGRGWRRDLLIICPAQCHCFVPIPTQYNRLAYLPLANDAQLLKIQRNQGTHQILYWLLVSNGVECKDHVDNVHTQMFAGRVLVMLKLSIRRQHKSRISICRATENMLYNRK